MKLTLSLLSLVASTLLLPVPAVANPSEGRADAGARPPHMEARCMSCELRRCAPDDAQSRVDARAPTRAYRARQGRCDAVLDTGYFPAEQDHIAAYLAKQHYPFE